MLAQPIADESFAFNSAYLYGVKEQPPRWRTCVTRTDEDLGEALGQEFVASNFSADQRQKAAEMIEVIQDVMGQRIRQLDWMSEATKERALQKLAAMRNKVGYPGKWRDYGPVRIDRQDHFGNRLRAIAFEEQRLLSRIGKPVDPDEWSMTPQTVNAYYDWLRNEMNFPAGVLQPPLFDTSIDAAPGWGNTGATVAHELIHGFDDTGRNFDARGSLADWWTPQDAAEFEKRTQCLVDQYGQYVVVDDIKLNSKLTLGEDIADLAGMVLAYVGWKSVTEGLALEPREGLTPAQRFFVGNAQWACGHQTDEQARVLARTDPHSPLRYRVNGVVINVPEFADAFGCKAGDPLYKKPEEVCRIW
jgi:putative endopeptidase